MATKNNGFLSVIPTVAAEVGVKNEDIVAIAVSRRERALKAAVARVTQAGKDARDSVAKQKKEIEDLLQAQAESQIGDRAAALRIALEALGEKVSGQSIRWVKSSAPDSFEAYVSLSMDVSKSLSHPANPYTGFHTAHRNSVNFGCEALVLTDEITSRLATLKATEAEIDTAIGQVHALREELKNIGEIERSARAQLAEATLSTSEGGRAILDVMGAIPGLMEVPSIGLVLTVGGE